MTLSEQAAMLYPHSVDMQKRWLAAKTYVAKVPPRFAKLMPMTTPVAAARPTPRTLREADL